MGLRERKKEETRAALIRAAWKLSAERGAANVRVEDIAAEAGVSARTVGNYFASKEEMMLAIGHERAARVAAELLARPSGEPLWEALVNAQLSQFTGERAFTRAQVEVGGSTPELVAAQVDVHKAVEPVLAEAVARRIGLSAGDLYPRLVAGVVVATTRIAIDHWRRSAGLSLPEVLRDAMLQVSHGLPLPPEPDPHTAQARTRHRPRTPQVRTRRAADGPGPHETKAADDPWAHETQAVDGPGAHEARAVDGPGPHETQAADGPRSHGFHETRAVDGSGRSEEDQDGS